MVIFDVQSCFDQAMHVNSFFAVRASWHSHVDPRFREDVVAFWRPSFRSRLPSCSASVQRCSAGVMVNQVGVFRSFDQFLVWVYICRNDAVEWRQVSYEHLHHYIAPCDQEPLWCAGYGVVRSNITKRD